MPEDPLKPHTPQEIVDVETIQNIDTARMALRWALERMHKLDQEKAAMAEHATASDKARERAEQEYLALQKTLSLRSGESDQRELYYRRIEEYLTLRLEGKLDVAALAKRELEASQLQELLQQKAVQLEKDFSMRRAAMEKEYRHLRAEAEQGSRDRARQVESSFEAKRAALEQEHLSRMAEVHEKDILLRTEQRALAERQKQFEEYYEAQRAELQASLKSFRADIDEQVRFRVRMAERLLEERHGAVEAGWSREKALMQKELESLRQKAQDAEPRILELERSLTRSEEAERQARSEADARSLALEDLRRGWLQEKTALQSDIAEWRGRAENHAAQSRELERALSSCGESLAQARSATETAESRLAALRAGFEAEAAALKAERDELRVKSEERRVQSDELARRLAAAEEQAQRLAAAAEREMSALEQRRLASRREKEALALQIEEWKQRQQESLARIYALESKLGAADDAAARARQQSTALESRLAEQARAAELAAQASQSELLDARRRADELAARLLEHERALAAAEQTQLSEDRQFARLEEHRKSWDRERELLLAEISDARRKADEALKQTLEIEHDRAIADEALRIVDSSHKRSEARFAERQKAWEAERASLLLELQAARSSPKLALPET